MKNTILLFLFVIISTVSYSQTVYNQVARISMWLMMDSTNLSSDRGDYLEVLLSDTFSNSITSADKRKQYDETLNNAAILKPSTVLWKECRKYPQKVGAFDTIRISGEEFTQDSMWLKFDCTNFPANDFPVYLYDKKTGQYISVRRTNQRIVWVKIECDDNIGRRLLLIKRFYK